MDILVSNVSSGGNNQDSELIAPTGILLFDNHIHVTATGSSQVIKYTMCGHRVSSVNIPSPTGICVGKLADGTTTVFVASTSGSIFTYPDGKQYISPGGSLYGIAFYGDKLYVASYSAGMVLVYKGTTATPPYITDTSLRKFNYMPYGLTIHNKKLYISFIKQIMRQGFAYIDVYNLGCKGQGVHRLINRANLSISYGIVVKDDNIYISNEGTGKVSVFNREGDYISDLLYVNDGINGMQYNNNKLYFVAANDGGAMGSVGILPLDY